MSAAPHRLAERGPRGDRDPGGAPDRIPGRAGDGVQGWYQALGQAATGRGPLGVVDSEQVVDAAAAAAAAGGRDPSAVAAELGRATAEAQRRAGEQFPGTAGRPVCWRGFGALMPVLAGSPGAGASSVAAALTDGLQQAGRCVLLVDADDPARSGLSAAAGEDGPWTKAAGQVSVRYSWRDQALLARLETSLPVVTAGMVPPPPAWLPDPAPDPLHATVVDLGHGGWRAAAGPLYGAGGWLRRGRPAPRPLLVVRATRPSLRHAEHLLARLDPWIDRGAATPPCQLVVNAARRWPAGVAGAVGPRLEALVDDAVFVPHDDRHQVDGVTDAPVPARMVSALAALLDEWGLISSRGRR